MQYIDLHVHSNRSDGTLTPREVVRLASECGLSAFALTDHDSIDGIAEALEASSEFGVEVIPGVEFSTEHLGMDIHIVGLEYELGNPDFQKQVAEYRDERLFRNRKMIDRMAADGIDISWDKMEQAFGPIAWTRAHFGRYLLDHGYVREINEAFSTYIGEDCKYFVPRERNTPCDAVRLIRRYGGIPILAHPFQYRHLSRGQLEELIGDLKDAGLIGMEVYYSTYNEEQSAELLSLAKKYDLAPSGGSDFHGSNKPDISIGSGKNNLRIPYSILDGLRAKRKEAASHAVE